MINFPQGKINLGLNIIAKRPDGYHNLETCFYPVGLTDILEIIPAQETSFAHSGLVVSGSAEENLCLKAYRVLKNDFGMGNVNMHLHKIIPMGAGLGGGSSDGAATLLMLNEIFELNISKTELEKYASLLGSDCAFFIGNEAKFAEGRGEILSPIELNLKNLFLVLVKPDVHISTAEAYAKIELSKPEHTIPQILKLPVQQWKNHLVNDFEKNIFRKYPVIGSIKEKLYSLGAVYASMTGSGAAVYGIFEKPIDLKSEFSGFFYWGEVLK